MLIHMHVNVFHLLGIFAWIKENIQHPRMNRSESVEAEEEEQDGGAIETEGIPQCQTLYWSVLCAHLFSLIYEARMKEKGMEKCATKLRDESIWKRAIVRANELHPTYDHQSDVYRVFFFFLFLSVYCDAAGVLNDVPNIPRKKATHTHIAHQERDNGTKVQSSSIPCRCRKEFVQSTKYTRSQFTAFICWLKWCQSIL